MILENIIETVPTSNSFLDLKEILLLIIGALLGYLLDSWQHRHEYKEHMRHELFGTLLTIRLPNSYYNFMENHRSMEAYNKLCDNLKEVGNRCSILQLSNRKKYNQIKLVIQKIDELICFTQSHLNENGECYQVDITEVNAINKRKKEINLSFQELYRLLGTEDYKNIIYVGKTKIVIQYIKDSIQNIFYK